MLITTEARANAANHVKDLGETAARLNTARDQHQQLAEAAQAHKAQDAGDDQDTVQKTLEAQNKAIAGNDRRYRHRTNTPHFHRLNIPQFDL
jgi:type VI secretion system secreted protein VgrG